MGLSSLYANKCLYKNEPDSKGLSRSYTQFVSAFLSIGFTQNYCCNVNTDFLIMSRVTDSMTLNLVKVSACLMVAGSLFHNDGCARFCHLNKLTQC